MSTPINSSSNNPTSKLTQFFESRKKRDHTFLEKKYDQNPRKSQRTTSVGSTSSATTSAAVTSSANINIHEHFTDAAIEQIFPDVLKFLDFENLLNVRELNHTFKKIADRELGKLGRGYELIPHRNLNIRNADQIVASEARKTIGEFNRFIEDLIGYHAIKEQKSAYEHDPNTGKLQWVQTDLNTRKRYALGTINTLSVLNEYLNHSDQYHQIRKNAIKQDGSAWRRPKLFAMHRLFYPSNISLLSDVYQRMEEMDKRHFLDAQGFVKLDLFPIKKFLLNQRIDALKMTLAFIQESFAPHQINYNRSFVDLAWQLSKNRNDPILLESLIHFFEENSNNEQQIRNDLNVFLTDINASIPLLKALIDLKADPNSCKEFLYGAGQKATVPVLVSCLRKYNLMRSQNEENIKIFKDFSELFLILIKAGADIHKREIISSSNQEDEEGKSFVTLAEKYGLDEIKLYVLNKLQKK